MEDNRELGGKLTINGKTYAIFGGLNTIGRNKDAVVNIKNVNISQHHAMLILVDDDLHFISDLKSSNGTILNGLTLVPLQLYRLDDGASLHFGNIQATYQKCTSEESNQSCTSNETQTYYSQNFYNNETQTMDKTENMICRKQPKSTSQNSYYIPTQVLAKVATALENSYTKLHEQPTQIITQKLNIHNRTTQMLPPSLPTQLVENNEENTSKLNVDSTKNDEREAGSSHFIEEKVHDVDESIFDLHEAETQKISLESVESSECVKSSERVNKSSDCEKGSENSAQYDIHELETQVFPKEYESTTMAITNIEENYPKPPDLPSSQLVIDESVGIFESSVVNFSENSKDIDGDTLDSRCRDVAQQGSSVLTSDNLNDKSGISQDSDVVKPLGKSVNVFWSSQDSDGKTLPSTSGNSDIHKKSKELDDSSVIQSSQQDTTLNSDSDIVKPVLTSKRSTVMESTEEDSDSDDIRPLKKSLNIFDSIEQRSFEENDQEKTNMDDMEDDDDVIIRPVGKSCFNMFDSSQSSVNGNEVTIATEVNIATDTDLNGVTIATDNDLNKVTVATDTDLNEVTIATDTDLNEVNIATNSDLNVKDVSLTSENSNDSEDFMTMRKTSDVEGKSSPERKISLKIVENPRENRKLSPVLNSDSETDIESGDEERIPVKYTISESETENEGDDAETDVEKEPTENEHLISKATNVLNLQKENPGYSSKITNVSLNDSDFVPSTQESENKILKTVTTISQSSSKFENSEESFKLGLTQLLEEENDRGNSQEERTAPQSILPNHREILKKFTFVKKKNPNENAKETENSPEVETISASSSVEADRERTKSNNDENSIDKEKSTENNEFYEAQTQKLPLETENCVSEDDEVFLHPTQTPLGSRKLKRRTLVTENKEDEDLYVLSTQRLDQSPDVINEQHNCSDSIYLKPTQRCETPKINESSSVDDDRENSKKLDEDDIFASQQVNNSPKTTPSKQLESELENMFATQRFNVSNNEDSLDKLQNVIHEKPLVDTKLPEDDRDLEAILATQKMVESPSRSSRSPGNKKQEGATPVVTGPTSSVESQLEVLFASQSTKLPADKFKRPGNPLADIFQAENVVSQEEVSPVTNEDSLLSCVNMSESSSSKNKGLEQSFALLEAKSTKTRKSSRNNNNKILLEDEVTVTCSKSRRSLAVGPNDMLKKVIEENDTSSRGLRKRRGSSSSEASSTSSFTLNKKPKRTMKKIEEVENSDQSEDGYNSKTSKAGSKTRGSVRKGGISGNDSSCSSSNDPKEESATKRSRNVAKTPDFSHEDSSSSSTVLKSARIRKKPERFIEINDISVDENDNNKGRKRTNGTRKMSEKSADSASEFESDGKTGRKSGAPSNSDDSSSFGSDVTSTSSSIIVKRKGRSVVVERSGGDGKVSRKVDKEDVEVLATPSKIRRRNDEETTPSTSRNGSVSLETPSRSKRKLKPKVIFTMMENPQLESTIRQLGGSVVDNIMTSTVLITQAVKRSMKLLSAVGLGKPICSSKWIEESKKNGQFLDPWDYLLIDKEAEKKWDFSLKTSLERSSQEKLFEGYTFHLLVTNAVDVLKGAIECCGGKIAARIPKGCDKIVIVASTEQKDKYKKLLKQHMNVTVVEPEGIFDGVLRQEIRFDRHILR